MAIEIEHGDFPVRCVNVYQRVTVISRTMMTRKQVVCCNGNVTGHSTNKTPRKTSKQRTMGATDTLLMIDSTKYGKSMSRFL